MFTQKEKAILVIDIGSSSVGVALVNIEKKDKKGCIEIIMATRTSAVIPENLTFKLFMSEISKALEASLANLNKQKDSFKISGIKVFLSSPFYLSHTNEIKIRNDGKKFEISEKGTKRLLSAKSEEFKSKYPTLYSDISDDYTVILENFIMQGKLNGYQTNKIFGRIAETIELAQYLTIGSSKVIDRIKEIIQSKVSTSNIQFYSFPFAAFYTFKNTIKHKSNFLLIDVSGELTDLSVIIDGHLAENISFPRGKNFIVKGIANSLKIKKSEALTQLKLFIENSLDDNTKKQITQKIEELKQEWLDGLRKSLSSVMESTLLPNHAYIIGDDTLSNLFTDWMTDKSLVEFSLANAPIQSSHINTADIQDLCFNKRSVQADLFLQVEALFCQKVTDTILG